MSSPAHLTSVIRDPGHPRTDEGEVGQVQAVIAVTACRKVGQIRLSRPLCGITCPTEQAVAELLRQNCENCDSPPSNCCGRICSVHIVSKSRIEVSCCRICER